MNLAEKAFLSRGATAGMGKDIVSRLLDGGAKVVTSAHARDDDRS